ncbi:DUF6527 family protein [Pelagicoccus enzymogenes]|uniref:DUF6527 family protein n=1 Tax=Pelagicoccus enzymogenes TaxID=2773457 RepID=UPI003CE489D4
MRSLDKIKTWSGRLFRCPAFGRIEYVDDWPKGFSQGVVYVQVASNGPWSLAFECPCGCREAIYLNLLKESRPAWNFEIRWFKGLTINPSVWRKVGCRSHFFVRQGEVVWA